jgi:hypothetical protein
MSARHWLALNVIVLAACTDTHVIALGDLPAGTATGSPSADTGASKTPAVFADAGKPAPAPQPAPPPMLAAGAPAFSPLPHDDDDDDDDDDDSDSDSDEQDDSDDAHDAGHSSEGG